MRSVALKKIEIPEFLSEIYKEMSVSPINLLQNYALNHIRSKIHKYEAEESSFRKKYGCDFGEFEIRIGNMENEENFEWEDDLMDWKFAVENLIYWQKKEQLFSAK